MACFFQILRTSLTHVLSGNDKLACALLKKLASGKIDAQDLRHFSPECLNTVNTFYKILQQSALPQVSGQPKELQRSLLQRSLYRELTKDSNKLLTQLNKNLNQQNLQTAIKATAEKWGRSDTKRKVELTLASFIDVISPPSPPAAASSPPALSSLAGRVVSAGRSDPSSVFPPAGWPAPANRIKAEGEGEMVLDRLNRFGTPASLIHNMEELQSALGCVDNKIEDPGFQAKAGDINYLAENFSTWHSSSMAERFDTVFDPMAQLLIVQSDKLSESAFGVLKDIIKYNCNCKTRGLDKPEV